jgi:hypothetical protein
MVRSRRFTELVFPQRPAPVSLTLLHRALSCLVDNKAQGINWSILRWPLTVGWGDLLPFLREHYLWGADTLVVMVMIQWWCIFWSSWDLMKIVPRSVYFAMWYFLCLFLSCILGLVKVKLDKVWPNILSKILSPIISNTFNIKVFFKMILKISILYCRCLLFFLYT